MNDKLKMGGLILGGYLLGRTKNLKLALTIAAAVGATKATQNRDQIQGSLQELMDSSPELASLGEKITGRLAETGKNAARSAASKGVDQLSQKLQDQTEKMKSSLDEASEDLAPEPGGSEEQEESAAEGESSDEAPEEPAPEEEGTEPESGQAEEPKKPAPKKTSTSRRKSSTSSSTTRTSSTAKKPATSRKSQGGSSE